VTWLALLNRDDKPEACLETLRQTESLLKRGAVPQVTCKPLIIQIDLRNPFIFSNMPSWKPAFNQPVEKQMDLYRQPDFRQAFRKALQEPRIFSDKTLWGRLNIKEVTNPALEKYLWKTVADVAAERGKDALDTFLDLAIEDKLNIQFTMVARSRSGACLAMPRPTTASPSGRRAWAPAPQPRAIGSVPINAAIVVIMIGRNLTRHAS
jgi:N-acyl-D-aspartate/D-glutamate deacylase